MMDDCEGYANLPEARIPTTWTPLSIRFMNEDLSIRKLSNNLPEALLAYESGIQFQRLLKGSLPTREAFWILLQ